MPCVDQNQQLAAPGRVTSFINVKTLGLIPVAAKENAIGAYNRGIETGNQALSIFFLVKLQSFAIPLDEVLRS